MWPSRWVAGELTYDVERVGESACEAAAGSSRNPKCSVVASVLAPHVVKWGTAQLLSAWTAIAATWSGTRTGCVSVFLDSERFLVAAHAVPEVRPSAVVTSFVTKGNNRPTYACRKS